VDEVWFFWLLIRSNSKTFAQTILGLNRFLKCQFLTLPRRRKVVTFTRIYTHVDWQVKNRLHSGFYLKMSTSNCGLLSAAPPLRFLASWHLQYRKSEIKWSHSPVFPGGMLVVFRECCNLHFFVFIFMCCIFMFDVNTKEDNPYQLKCVEYIECLFFFFLTCYM